MSIQENNNNNNNNNDSIGAWISIAIPFRISFTMYATFKYEQLPPIKIDPEFKDIKTLDDVRKNSFKINKKIGSVTECYIWVNKQDQSFYRDKEDVVVWYFDPIIGVYVITNKENTIVAPDLPTFFTRMSIENGIAGKYLWDLYPIICLTNKKITKNIWNEYYEIAKKVMDKESLDYVSYYYEIGKQTIKD